MPAISPKSLFTDGLFKSVLSERGTRLHTKGLGGDAPLWERIIHSNLAIKMANYAKHFVRRRRGRC